MNQILIIATILGGWPCWAFFHLCFGARPARYLIFRIGLVTLIGALATVITFLNLKVYVHGHWDFAFSTLAGFPWLDMLIRIAIWDFRKKPDLEQ